jgi:hypothetical protein
MQLQQFFARKWLMTRYSKAFIVFPGGFGTLDELFEVLTLIQTKNLPLVPVILVGSEYWNPFLQWLNDKALHYGLVVEHELELFIVTDDLEQAFCLVRNECMNPIEK